MSTKVVMNILVWEENKRYAERAAAAQRLPVNEIMRRILADAEARGLFLTNDCFRENVSETQEAA